MEERERLKELICPKCGNTMQGDVVWGEAEPVVLLFCWRCDLRWEADINWDSLRPTDYIP